MELCIISNYKTIVDTSKKQNKSIGKGLRESKFFKVLREHPLEIIEGLAVATIIVSVVADISLNAGATVVCSEFQQGVPGELSKGFKEIELMFKEVINFAKKILVGSVIVNTIKECAFTIWRNGGVKMSWDDIFGSVLKNLTILAIGCGIEKLSWWIYYAIGQN